MRDTKAQKTARFYDGMARLGIGYDDANKLRRIEMTLHNWAEQECGDSASYTFGNVSWSIERDEETDKPYRVRHVTYAKDNTTKTYRDRVADREAGALRRLARILTAYPDLIPYHQTDPRGCALYLVRKSDLPTDMFEVVPAGNGWTIKRKGSDTTYSGSSETIEAAQRFAARETLDSMYTRGFGVCID